MRRPGPLDTPVSLLEAAWRGRPPAAFTHEARSAQLWRVGELLGELQARGLPDADAQAVEHFLRALRDQLRAGGDFAKRLGIKPPRGKPRWRPPEAGHPIDQRNDILRGLFDAAPGRSDAERARAVLALLRRPEGSTTVLHSLGVALPASTRQLIRVVRAVAPRDGHGDASLCPSDQPADH